MQWHHSQAHWRCLRNAIRTLFCGGLGDGKSRSVLSRNSRGRAGSPPGDRDTSDTGSCSRHTRFFCSRCIASVGAKSHVLAKIRTWTNIVVPVSCRFSDSSNGNRWSRTASVAASGSPCTLPSRWPSSRGEGFRPFPGKLVPASPMMCIQGSSYCTIVDNWHRHLWK